MDGLGNAGAMMDAFDHPRFTLIIPLDFTNSVIKLSHIHGCRDGDCRVLVNVPLPFFEIGLDLLEVL